MATDCSLPLPITSTASLFSSIFVWIFFFSLGFLMLMFLIFSSFHILHFRILYGMVSRKNAQQRWFNGLCFLALILVRRDLNHYNSLTKDNCPLSFVRFWKILVIMLWLLLEHIKIFCLAISVTTEMLLFASCVSRSMIFCPSCCRSSFRYFKKKGDGGDGCWKIGRELFAIIKWEVGMQTIYDAKQFGLIYIAWVSTLSYNAYWKIS